MSSNALSWGRVDCHPNTFGTAAYTTNAHCHTQPSASREIKAVLDRNFHYLSGTGIYLIPDIDVKTARHIDN